MIKFPSLNRHMIGVSAVALAILSLGIATTSRTPHSLNELTEFNRPEVTQAWVNPADQSQTEPTISALLKEIPLTAYGSSQHMQPVQPEAASKSRQSAMATAKGVVAGPEGKDWSAQEWEIASKAVSAYRSVAKVANSLTRSEPSNDVWQPPEEIAKSSSEQR